MPNPEEVAKHPRRSERTDDAKSGPAAKRRKVEADIDDAEVMLPPRENTREKALSITEQYIVQQLTPKEAAGLVIEALVGIIFIPFPFQVNNTLKVFPLASSC